MLRKQQKTLGGYFYLPHSVDCARVFAVSLGSVTGMQLTENDGQVGECFLYKFSWPYAKQYEKYDWSLKQSFAKIYVLLV